MTISDSTIKRLWGASAGRCAFPDCNTDCLSIVQGSSTVILGEMAHIIAKSPSGPRGITEGGTDEYGNLILLCPTHHALVDKAQEGCFSKDTLLTWKLDHESRVREKLRSPIFNNRAELNTYIRKKLLENKTCWSTYGPEGDVARGDPNSNIANLWSFRKLSLIIPNNRCVLNAISEYSAMFNSDEYKLCCRFREHAEGFEKASIEPMEGIPRFPIDFERIFYE